MKRAYIECLYDVLVRQLSLILAQKCTMDSEENEWKKKNKYRPWQRFLSTLDDCGAV